MKRLRLRDTALFTAVFSQREAVEVLLKELIGRKDLVIEEITPTFIEEHFISPDHTCVSVACKNENFEDVKVGFYLTLNTDVVPLANSFRDNYYLDLIESKRYAQKHLNETIQVFLSNCDALGHGLSVHHCYDRVEEIPDFEGGLHQYFVNLDCDGESQIRSLLDDFNEADETIISNPVLAYIVSQQKNLEEGTNLLHKIFKVFDNSNNRKDEQYE